MLYGSAKGSDINFDGDLSKVWKERQYAAGTDCTVIGTGAMLDVALRRARTGGSFDIFNPFVLNPLRPLQIIESVRKTGRLCVVQESTATAGSATGLFPWYAGVLLRLKKAPVLVSAPDAPVPFASELEVLYRPDKDRVKLVIRN